MKLTIPTPCHENWSAMTPSEKGRFCGSCQKQVIDFTGFSDRQLLNFFKPGQGEVCGRLESTQVNHVITQAAPVQHGSILQSMYSRLLALALTATVSTSHASCLDCTKPNIEAGPVKLINQGDSLPRKVRLGGRVLGEDGKPLSGATVRITGIKQTTISDAGGWFFIAVTQTKSHQVFSAAAEKAGFIPLDFQLASDGTKVKVKMVKERYVIIGAVSPVQH